MRLILGLLALVLAIAGSHAGPTGQTRKGSGYASDHNKIMGCYWGAWSVYRPGDGQFVAQSIDPMLCSHGYYGFADMDEETWEVFAYDPWYDLAPSDCGETEEEGGQYCHYDGYRSFVALREKNPDFVPIISIGGWNAGSGKFSEMAAKPERRAIFIETAVELATTYGFMGVDFDWEYPGTREGANEDEDKDNFATLVEEMGEVLRKEGLIFTAALSPAKNTIDIAYDIDRIMEVFDFVNIMTYDYHGAFEDHNFTGHNAPLYGRVEEEPEDHPGYYFNVFATLDYFLEIGTPKEKMVMGMPLYGRGFELTNWEGPDAETGLYCPTGPGVPWGPYTRQNGIWDYQEILQAFNNETLNELMVDAEPQSWTIVVDDCYRAPYAYNGPYWIGYDDETSIDLKAQYMNFLELAGAFVWSIDGDDFRGTNSAETYPLIKTINRGIASGLKLDLESEGCEGTAPMCDTFDEPTTTTEMSTTTTPMVTTPSGDDGECTETGQVLPYPGDCHLYMMCMENTNGGFDTVVYDCGDSVFDPNIDACVDPGMPAEDNICGLPSH